MVSSIGAPESPGFKADVPQTEGRQSPTLESLRIEVTPIGRFLIRNIAAVFDAYLKRSPQQSQN